MGGIVKIAGTFCGKPGFQCFHRSPFVVKGEVGVAHGHGDVFVSEQFLHGF
jgi:hypothetical protein